MLGPCKVLKVKKLGPFTLQNWALQLWQTLLVVTQKASPWAELPDEVSHLPHCAAKGLIVLSAIFLAKPSCKPALTWGLQLLAAALIYTHLMLSRGKQWFLFSLGTWRRVWIPVSQAERLDGKGYVHTIKNNKTGFGTSLWVTRTVSHPCCPGHVPL